MFFRGFSFLFLAGLAVADPGTDSVLSLNGTWKFTTIPGDGNNPLSISVEDEDVVIDNDDSGNVSVSGDWKLETMGYRGTPVHGGNAYYRYFGGKEEDAYVRYASRVPRPGYYEHFVKTPFAFHMAARYKIKHADGITIRHNNQKVRIDQWVSLGVFRIDPDENHYIEVGATAPGHVTTDVVMYRPVSDEAYRAAEEARNSAYAVELDDSRWDDLTVPGHWGMLNAYSNYTGKGWYRKRFSLPPDWDPEPSERIYLKFEGVYHLARVFLNGEYIGSHRGGFTPFEFDVTDGVKAGSENLLAVEADNNFLVGATWNWGGIIRDVSLVKSNDLRITYQYMHAEPDLENGEAELSLVVRVENTSNVEREVAVRSAVSRETDRPVVLAALAGTVRVPPGDAREIQLSGMLAGGDVDLWHFDTPNLYRVITVASDGGRVLDRRSDRFGIRRIEVDDTHFYLNGEPVRLAGFNRISDHRYWGSSEPRELIDRDIDLMKNAGANMTRIMHGTQNKKLLEACDEKGMLLFEEVNVRDLTNPEFVAPDYDVPKQWLRGMIERDVNHPSIIGWSTGNELRDHYEYVKTTIDYVKSELDPHRLVACVSNTGHRSGHTPENDPLGLGDVILQNCYFQSPDDMVREIRKKWPDKPVFFSEFGIYRFDSTTSLDHELKGLEGWHRVLRGRNPFIIGASLWSFNDYRSAFLSTHPSENRAWGLVNVWRQKRRFYDQAQKLHSPVKFSDISAIIPEKGRAGVVLHLRGPEDYPSFTLRDYDLVWSFRDIRGRELSANRLDLPDLPPTIGSWSGTITWGALPEEVHEFNIRLMTPNGYVRFERTIPFETPEEARITSITPGDRKVRVHFDEVPSAAEYSVEYANRYGRNIRTEPTINPFIDVEGLTNGHSHAFKLIAWNERGFTTSRDAVNAFANGTRLPPVIWDAFITDGTLVIGYDGHPDDISYEVHYGTSPDDLDQALESITRGMMTVDLGGASEVSFKLRRTTPEGTSNWSRILTVKEAEPSGRPLAE